jgi:predicted Rossmann fold flavoprotein
MMKSTDVLIIGAGAAGLMCAIEAGKRGRRVLVLDKSNKPGKKILMSGGGRCNFTNQHTTPQQFISHNAHFCKSALSRYTPEHFIEMVQRHRISFFEKKLGQLFCEEKAMRIVDMLLSECQQHDVEIKLQQHIEHIQHKNNHFILESNQTTYQTSSLIVATGGLSIPTLGSSPFGYQIAKQFGLNIYPTRAGLVPFTLHEHDKTRFTELSGISLDCVVSCNGASFRENMLFTHRGLSGPAMLQISSFWHPGDALSIHCLPDLDLHATLLHAQKITPDSHCKTILSQYFPKRLLDVFLDENSLNKAVKQFTQNQLQSIALQMQHWSIKPNATEGYRTAEVTLGGVDCNEVSSKTFETNKQPGLYFIGEVLDVTGWLGGYNFQWAWASGWAAGQVA